MDVYDIPFEVTLYKESQTVLRKVIFAASSSDAGSKALEDFQQNPSSWDRDIDENNRVYVDYVEEVK